MCRLNDLRNKEVINISSGKRLGFVCDVELDIINGKILALILPPRKSSIFSFVKDDDTIIKWNQIKKIGNDIIIVDFEEKTS